MSRLFTLEGKSLRLDTAADIEQHIKPLRDNDTVEEVRLGGNTLGTEACKALAEVLQTKKTLQIANLADIFTSRLLSEIPPALDYLLTALLTLPDLHTVDLSDNAFGLNTQAPLVAFLSAHTPLRHLYLNNNGLGPKAGVLIADALTSLAEKKAAARAISPATTVPNLETVICGRNRLENGSMAAWAKAYAAHSGVQKIKMVQNGIRQEGISHLLREGLRHASGLRVLDLQDNTFTIMGANALADVLAGWPDLRELGISDSFLTARGGLVLAKALNEGKNAKLEVLRLQFNDLDIKGVTALKDVARDALPALRRIELNGNKFSEEDASVETLRELLDERREKAGAEEGEGEDAWGLDSLSDLEDESDEEEEEEEDEDQEDEDEEPADKVVKGAEEAEEENVAEEKDKGVDELADKLGKTGL
ncbi:MAG: hypothetical protein M1819_004943 [Sarea resinae]|nr:MAG: hypothetical protein M1819_004943 [Sarea resinae]